MTSSELQALLDEVADYRCFCDLTVSERVQLALWLRYLSNLDGAASHAPIDLYNAGRAYAPYGSMTSFMALKLGILYLIAYALDSTADLTVGAMLVSGMNMGCFGATVFDIIETALLDVIAANA